MDSAKKGIFDEKPKGGKKGDKQFTQIESLDQYQQQYDPNNDFAIFNVGNDAMGGVQTMQEKMNLADKVDSSSDEDEAAPQQQQDKNKLSVPAQTRNGRMSSTS